MVSKWLKMALRRPQNGTMGPQHGSKMVAFCFHPLLDSSRTQIAQDNPPALPPSFLPPGFGKGFGRHHHASILPVCFEFLCVSTKFGSLCLVLHLLFSVNDIHDVFLSSPIAKAVCSSSALVSFPGFLSHGTKNVAPSHFPGVKSSRVCRQRRSRHETFEKGCTLP